MVCASNSFVGMGCTRSPNQPLVHVYCKVLWEHKYMHNYPDICDQFHSLVYELIFCKQHPRLTNEAIEVLKIIGDWYMYERSTYIRIYGVTNAPQSLLAHVPKYFDLFLLMGLAYNLLSSFVESEQVKIGNLINGHQYTSPNH